MTTIVITTVFYKGKEGGRQELEKEMEQHRQRSEVGVGGDLRKEPLTNKCSGF